MASLFKPLFNDNVLKAKLTGFGKPSLSPEQTAVVQAWASTAANETATIGQSGQIQ